MSSKFYHFTQIRPAEDLIFSEKHKLSGHVAKYFTNFQVDGLRFLYKNYEKKQACILNDEKNLGKTPLVAAFLQTILPQDTSIKCLIIARTDERLQSWKYHLDILVKSKSKFLTSEKDLGSECIYLVKWDVLRNSLNLTYKSFNCIILDDRENITYNRIFLNYLLQHYENKISLIVASADVTLDLIQLHGLLRLCNHLERKYKLLSVFQEQFCLPKITGHLESKNILEKYFQQREKINNYCREFRLRRYRHQFESELPLVSIEEYKKHYRNWSENTFLQSSTSSSVNIISSSSEKDAEELLKTYFTMNNDKDVDEEVRKITEIGQSKNETEKEMSPLVFYESESEDSVQEDSPQEELQVERLHEISYNSKDDKKNMTIKKRRYRTCELNKLNDCKFGGRITRSKSKKNCNIVFNVSQSVELLNQLTKRKKNEHPKMMLKRAKKQTHFEEKNTLKNVSTEENSNSKQKSNLQNEINDCSSLKSMELRLTSSSEESNNNNNNSTQSSRSFRVSPDIFNSLEERNLTYSQKMNYYSSCTEVTVLEKQVSHYEVTSKTSEIIEIDSQTISPLKNRTNDMKTNKITKYFVGDELSSSASTDSTPKVLLIDCKKPYNTYPRTPKKPPGFQKSIKKSPKASTSRRITIDTTPNSLTKWLIKSDLSKTSTKRKRLELFFKS